MYKYVCIVLLVLLIIALVYRRDQFTDPRNTPNLPPGVYYVPWARNPNILASQYTVPAAHFPAESGVTGAWKELQYEIRGGYDPKKDKHFIDGLP